MRQLKLLAKQPSAYGGELLKTRKGRSRGRPLATRSSMHLVLRSSKATGAWSLRRSRNRQIVNAVIARFSAKYDVRIYALANVGNHLHLHLQLARRESYRPFIRAITAAIAMKVMGRNRWTKANGPKVKFWDHRPFSRIVIGFKDFLRLKDYVRINVFEGLGYSRFEAELLVRRRMPLQV